MDGRASFADTVTVATLAHVRPPVHHGRGVRRLHAGGVTHRDPPVLLHLDSATAFMAASASRAQHCSSGDGAGRRGRNLHHTIEPAVDLRSQRCLDSPDCVVLILPGLLPVAHWNVLLIIAWSADKEG